MVCSFEIASSTEHSLSCRPCRVELLWHAPEWLSARYTDQHRGQRRAHLHHSIWAKDGLPGHFSPTCTWWMSGFNCLWSVVTGTSQRRVRWLVSSCLWHIVWYIQPFLAHGWQRLSTISDTHVKRVTAPCPDALFCVSSLTPHLRLNDKIWLANNMVTQDQSLHQHSTH